MMAVNIERFVSEGKGNGVRALLSIKPGEVIYSCEPFAFCIAKDFLKTTCQSCFKRGESLSRCSQCKTARYCSVQCQKQAWLDHKRECKCLQRLQPRIPTDSVRLVARIIFKLLSQSKSDQEELYSIAEHQSHLDVMSEEKKEGLRHLCTTLQVYLGEENCNLSELPSGLDPISLLARVTCNCFSISDGELQDLGVGLYPSMSLLNHDCRPNCVMIFEGKRLTLRAVKVIRPCEELTISYTDVLAPSEERRSRLQEQYHFLCQCARCTAEDKDCDMLAGETTAWTSLRDALPHLEQLQSEQHWEELLKESQALLLRYADVIPDRNIYVLRLLDLAMDACISLDHYETALEYGNRALGPYKLYFSDPHPSRAVELLRVGKLQHYLGRLKEAHGSFTQAYDIMKVTHGTEHALTNEVSRKLGECQAELGEV
ncbi:histone-lysine N-methyltransferase SMYD3 [Pimephales promelas]|uniref:histone-lysine N-methyltransferase SMYD3 n=1 Tax=Pimephales promelas TaxID=90988 RepID=UPI001955A605|nr:histone-lysine N-methyltransferase SMYD3 [Pimephales promelas]KAG1973171.1 histone-lysine N-methyltransferase SMYD3 [Pimephales promelas]